MKKQVVFCSLLFCLVAISCTLKQDGGHVQPVAAEKEWYTCPMPEDSILSDKPGTCPKCGMDLVKQEADSAGKEPDKLQTILRPTNEFVISSIPVTTMEPGIKQIEIDALGTIAYDTRQVGSISARVAGRIEKLYVRNRFQKVSKGQKILEIYSPELMTAQQNLLFLIKNDANNSAFIEAAKDKLRLLGMGNDQIQRVIQTGRPSHTISVYSHVSGHIQESPSNSTMKAEPGTMRNVSMQTEELSLKEGMYLQKGQTIFSVFNSERAWAVLNIYGDNQAMVKTGQVVRIVPETAPEKDFRSAIDFVEPFYRTDSKTLTVRVYFDNSELKIPIGSQVRATIFGIDQDAFWLPKEAVLSLGIDKVVFLRSGNGFRAKKIRTGVQYQKQIQIVGGLNANDSVAVNAQFLMDSESFIKVKD